VGEIKWTSRAHNDLQAIYDFISLDNPAAALAVARRIVTSTERLAAFSESGRSVPEHQGSGVRELIVRPYRIAYRVVGSEVRILKVHHGARMLRFEDIEDVT
jgi:toxin ParE1/3/4